MACARGEIVGRGGSGRRPPVSDPVWKIPLANYSSTRLKAGEPHLWFGTEESVVIFRPRQLLVRFPYRCTDLIVAGKRDPAWKTL